MGNQESTSILPKKDDTLKVIACIFLYEQTIKNKV